MTSGVTKRKDIVELSIIFFLMQPKKKWQNKLYTGETMGMFLAWFYLPYWIILPMSWNDCVNETQKANKLS